MVSEVLKQTWAAVVSEASRSEGYYHRRIPLPSFLPAHAGIHCPTDARVLILEMESRAIRDLRLKDETKGYSIDVYPDEAGRTDRVAIRIQEAGAEYREIFTIFCVDVLDHWIPHVSSSDSIQSLSRRLARWKKFFQRGSGLGLNRENYIGLYGELSFLESGLRAGGTGLAMVEAWQAPLGTNQDFLFGSLAVEIKTVTGNEIDRVHITSARQLDSTGLQHLFLARYAFDFRQGAGRTLPRLIADLKAIISASSPDSLPLFGDRLLDAGFVEAIPNELDDWGFTPRHFDAFELGSGFPRLLESNIPSGISEISYTLNLSAAASFKIVDLEFWERIIPSNV